MQIIVLGMHRSGTSLLSRILNLMGCYFGTEDVTLARQPDNPKGFWERTDVIAINDIILTAAGGSWWDVESLNFHSIAGTDLAYIQEQIGNIVLKMDAHRPWFIKDPRMCLTLSYWLPFLECPMFLISNRSPIKSTQSLHARNSIPIAYSLLLWEYYMVSMFQNIGNYRRHHVDYEQILKTPFESCKGLYELLIASGVSGLRMPNRHEVEAFVDPTLCHYQDKKAAQAVLLSASQQTLATALHEGLLMDTMTCDQKILLNMIRQEKNKGNWVESLFATSQRGVPPNKTSPAALINCLEARYTDLKTQHANLEARYTDLKTQHANLEARYTDLKTYQHRLSQKWWVRCIVFVHRLLGRDHRLDLYRK